MNEIGKNNDELDGLVNDLNNDRTASTMPAFLERAARGEVPVASSESREKEDRPDTQAFTQEDEPAVPEQKSNELAGNFFAEGVASVKEMSAARRAHAEARDELGRLEYTISERECELEHRRDVETRYESIVSSESSRLQDASAAKRAAEQRIEELAGEISQAKKKLDDMRDVDATTERRLKSALEAAEDKEKSARESGRRLQRRVDDAKHNLERAKQEREEGVVAAQKAIESAAALLDTLNNEFADLQRTPSVNPAEYSVRSAQLDGEIADAADALRLAQEDLPRVQYETQAAVDAAVVAVGEAERPIASAKASFEAVAAAADEARDAYGTAKDEAEARQKEQRRVISTLEKASKEQQRVATEQQEIIDASQALIDEANDIHAHPEATEALARALEADRAERLEREGEIEELAATEHAVRERTRNSRIRFMVFVAAVALAIILVVWLVFLR